MAIARVSWNDSHGKTRHGVLVGFVENDGIVMCDGGFRRVALYGMRFEDWCDD